jgi:hypothetical protein
MQEGVEDLFAPHHTEAIVENQTIDSILEVEVSSVRAR